MLNELTAGATHGAEALPGGRLCDPPHEEHSSGLARASPHSV